MDLKNSSSSPLDNSDNPAEVFGKIIIATVVTFVIVGLFWYAGLI
ncbi:MAG TPA: hypothetical protein PLM07_10085 [Candidatus Rifleibacterium sp.]|nr:hypothetical protein [Candidatus Rifleibacterium sp.]HPT46237.1 hypothetical protein [Candidatus Rifleibacterium sp.]